MLPRRTLAGASPKALPCPWHVPSHILAASSSALNSPKQIPWAFADLWRPTAGQPKSCNRQLLEGRTGEYAEATADAFLDDWLKTDADRARDAAAAFAAAAASAGPPAATTMLSPQGPQHGSPFDGVGGGPADALSGGYDGAERRSSATHHNSGAHGTPKKRRPSQDHGHGNDHHHHNHHHRGDHHHDRSHGGGGRHEYDRGKRRSPHDPARAERSSSSDSEGGRSLHARYGGDGGHGHKVSAQRRRNAAPGPVSPASNVSRTPHADSQEFAADRHHLRNRADRSLTPLDVLSHDKSNTISSATERKGASSKEAGDGSGSLNNVGPQTQTGSAPRNLARDDAEERESLRRAHDEASQLRATVERLKSELDSVKAATAGTGFGVGGMTGIGGDGLGQNASNGGIQFGATVAPMGGPPWAAGGMRHNPVALWFSGNFLLTSGMFSQFNPIACGYPGMYASRLQRR